MRSILLGLIALTAAQAVIARGPVHVRGYVTKSGKYVAPHYRSAPDRSRYNNWSTVGNVNPYTGKPGYKYPGGSTSGSYHYSIPSYGAPAANYGYTSLSPGYGQPTYSPPDHTPPDYGRPTSIYRMAPQGSRSAVRSPLAGTAYRPAEQAVILAPGVIKVPAPTMSGFCLKAPANYVGTGSFNYPAISSALPLCESI